MPRKKTTKKKTAPKAPSTFTFRIDDDLRDTIEQEAKNSGMSVSSFIHKFLSDHVGELSATQRLTDIEKRLTALEHRPASILVKLTDQTAMTTEMWADFVGGVDAALAGADQLERVDESVPADEEASDDEDAEPAEEEEEAAAAGAAA
jgi:uncharacterized protein (DUF1778 family)